MSKIIKIEEIDTPEYVYDPCCEYPHSYISNGFVSHNCVLLVDEIEKIFGNSDDSGVSGRLLSALLWWLQERTSRILVVMTTNDESVIPVELYRPGRIDEGFEFVGISDYVTAESFMKGVLDSMYPSAAEAFTSDVLNQLKSVHKFPITENENEEVIYTEPVSHASLTQVMHRAIKNVLVTIK